MRLGDVGRSVFGISRVYVRPGILRAFAIVQHTHHILGDVHADGTAEGMIVEGDLPIGIHIRNIAIVIGSVTDVAASAIAGNILHDVGISGIELVGFLHSHRRVLNIHWHLVERQHGKMHIISFGSGAGRNRSSGQRQNNEKEKELSGL